LCLGRAIVFYAIGTIGTGTLECEWEACEKPTKNNNIPLGSDLGDQIAEIVLQHGCQWFGSVIIRRTPLLSCRGNLPLKPPRSRKHEANTMRNNTRNFHANMAQNR